MKTILLFLVLGITIASCNNGAEQQAAAQARQLDSMKTEMAKQRVIDSMNAVAEAQAQEQAEQSRSHTTTNNTTTVYRDADNTKQSTANAPAKQRKGLGPVAAGTIIGAGAGAVTGAMVGKKKGEGAVIGGIIGAGAGAGTGAIIKNAQKKKDAQK